MAAYRADTTVNDRCKAMRKSILFTVRTASPLDEDSEASESDREAEDEEDATDGFEEEKERKLLVEAATAACARGVSAKEEEEDGGIAGVDAEAEEGGVISK